MRRSIRSLGKTPIETLYITVGKRWWTGILLEIQHLDHSVALEAVQDKSPLPYPKHACRRGKNKKHLTSISSLQEDLEREWVKSLNPKP
jgi:hypothetical protein